MKRLTTLVVLALSLAAASGAVASTPRLSPLEAQRAAREDAASVCSGLEGCVRSSAGPCRHQGTNKFACQVEWRIDLGETYECEGGFCQSVAERYRCVGTDTVSLRRGRIAVSWNPKSTFCTEPAGGGFLTEPSIRSTTMYGTGQLVR